ncbi:MAG: hypothetical protein JXB50_09885, partial [Spirochaetes bacterium]|nr:hypothetical protein [Spirochaetota bacterium]
MKKFLNKNFTLNIVLITVFIIIIIIASKLINIDSSINSLFPNDEKLALSANISKESPNAQKVIFYLEVDDENKLIKSIDLIKKTINEQDINFTNTIPSSDEVLKLWEYTENNSLLLYPYETAKNPFTDEEIKKRLNNKYNYLISMPLFNLNDSFFKDPLMFTPELLNQLKQISSNKYTPNFGGIISEDKKSFMLIYSVDFKNEDYKKIINLKKLDNKIINIGKENNFKSFMFSSHFYFLESKSKITQDITIIFILTSIFVVIIFYLFFKNLLLIFYTAMPILGGYALTFLIIALIKPNFGGIALSFGSSIIGISIDYIVHYLSKRNYYSTLSETRKKIGLSLFLGAMTTLAAFALLLFAKIESLNEIALFGLISITIVYLISWFIMQPLVPPEKNEGKNNKLVFKIPFINNRILFYLWLGSTVILLMFLPLIKFEDNVMNLDMNHKELEARKKIILEKFKESNDNIFLSFTADNRDEMIEKSLNALNIIKSENRDLAFITPALLMPTKKTT